MGNEYTYDVWMESQGIPIHRGYYIEDLRTVEVAPWSLRGCDAAFVQLEGMQGVVESRVQEIAPGASLPPFKAAMDEVVYVLSGQGSASVWGKNANNKHNFEWSARSMFVLHGTPGPSSPTCRATVWSGSYTTTTCRWGCRP